MLTYQPGLLLTYQPGLLLTYQPGLLLTYQTGLLLTYQTGLLLTYQTGLYRVFRNSQLTTHNWTPEPRRPAIVACEPGALVPMTRILTTDH